MIKIWDQAIETEMVFRRVEMKASMIFFAKEEKKRYIQRENILKRMISCILIEKNTGWRKRERDDVYDQWRRDDPARLRDDDQHNVHNVRLKEEGLFQRERNERQRERE